MNPNWIELVLDPPPLADAIFKISIALALAWLIHWAILRRNPRWRVLLWRGTAAGLIVLPLLGLLLPELSLPVVPQPQSGSWEYVSYNQPAVFVGGMSYAPAMGLGGGSVAAAAQPSRFEILKADAAYWIRTHPVELLLAGWLAIAALLGVGAMRSGRRFRRIVVEARPAPAPVLGTMRHVSKELGWKRSVALLVSPEIASPVLVGLRRPAILLPESAVASDRHADLKAILAHELSHLKSHDLLWSRVMQWLSILLWFHPLAWCIRGAHTSACEEVSDSVAADYVGDAADYSGTLARVALALVRGRQPLGGIPMARRSQIGDRLATLKRKIRAIPIRKRWVVASLAAGLIALATLGGLKLTYARDNSRSEAATKSSTVVLPSLSKPDSGALLDLKTGKLVPNEGGGSRALNDVARGDLAYRAIGGSRALLALRGASMRLWTGNEFSSPAPDIRSGTVQVYILKETPCHYRVSAAGGREFELTILSADDKAAKVEFRVSDGNLPEPDATETSSALQLEGKAETESTSAVAASREAHVLHFPANRSLGELEIQDETVEHHLITFDTFRPKPEWVYFAQARGDVVVPRGKRVHLRIMPDGWSDLSPLAKLRPNDLYRLSFQVTGPPWARVRRASDSCMPHLAHLTGLRELMLQDTDITDRGMRHIVKLQSLARLTPPNIGDEGLAHIVKLKSLKELQFAGNHVSNAGVAQLAGLPALEELWLGSGYTDRSGRAHYGGMTDAALAHLAQLRSLKHLHLFSPVFTDVGMAHIRKIPSLKTVQLTYQAIGDSGVGQLAGHPTLEGLALAHTKITDRGVAQLTTLPSLTHLALDNAAISDAGLAQIKDTKSLKYLSIRGTKVTPAGIAHLKGLLALETLYLSHEMTDEGLAALSGMSRLRFLWAGASSNSPITDAGLAHLADLPIETLVTAGSGITDAGASYFATMPNLRYLNLYASRLTDAGLGRLAEAPRLEHLEVHSPKSRVGRQSGRLARFTRAGVSQFSKSSSLTELSVGGIVPGGGPLDLNGMKQLRELTLSFQPKEGGPVPKYVGAFHDEDLAGLAELRQLRSLWLSPSDFTDTGLHHLADLTALETLGLRGAGLTDAGLSALANHQSLRSLSLEGDITDAGLRHLEGLKQLTSLTIESENTCSRTAIERLRAKLPNLVTLKIVP